LRSRLVGKLIHNPGQVLRTGAQVKDAAATLTADKWSYLHALTAAADVEASATVTVREPGKQKAFFGESWSVWPEKTFDDQGWDAGLLLRWRKLRLSTRPFDSVFGLGVNRTQGECRF
jgi:hypothetical protein